MNNIAPQKNGHVAEAAELNRLLSVNLRLSPADRRNGLHQPLETEKIADLLRSTTATLKDLGIDKIRNSVTGLDTYHWEQLKTCLQEAQDDDAMVVFKAMVARLSRHRMVDVSPVMTEAMRHSWRMQAIEMMPEFFLMVRTEKLSSVWNEEAGAHNAFYALASIDEASQSSKESTRACLHALKDIGLQDFPRPEDLVMCLHMAAFRHVPESFSVFVSEFPEQLEAMNKQAMRPLHLAASSSHSGNVKSLLDAGAQPRPMSPEMGTPLRIAASNQRYENAMLLVGTGAYTEHDLDVAGDFIHDVEQIHRLRACHAAVKARGVVDEAGQNKDSTLKPL